MYVDDMGVYRCSCDMPIVPYRRVKDGYTTCISCAEKEENTKVGFMVFDHKTAPTLIQIDSHDKESLRRAQRAHRRAR